MITFCIVYYPDLVQPGAGRTESDEYGEPIRYGSREHAEAALRRQYPGKTLSEIFVHAQKRVESCYC